MDLTLALAAAIFTLLALVVATSLFGGSSPAAEFASYFGHAVDGGATGGSDEPGPTRNGSPPHGVKEKKKEEEEKKEVQDDWCEISGSSHDHWELVKSVLSEEAHSHPPTGELPTPVECSSTSKPCAPRLGCSHKSLEADWLSGPGRRSFIGLSDKQLLRCAFSYPQTEGATESPEVQEKLDSDASESLRYAPGKARSHHLQRMMSKDELEEERRVQREQLAAIFQLLKENQETFGEVSDGDMEEQLRLYSI
ncbi:serine and arginine rich splicing factor 2a isoform X1 [Pungitius pungitius]|uniref:serine and arginine rich splicing factor 2a isoform X1 n=1 Tax=Pungitius pungitius TaxID=134920 RepID=UPI002E1068C4